MRSNLRMLLGGLVLVAGQMERDMRRSCVVVSNPQKRNSTKKVKNKKSGCKQAKYSSTKPIKSKAQSQFRNKSNI
jgi:hypothetical protein